MSRPDWLNCLGPGRVDYLDQRQAVHVGVWTEAMRLDDEGYSCSCHLAPPCGFCVALEEEEIAAYADGGMAGLRELWDRVREAACPTSGTNTASGQAPAQLTMQDLIDIVGAHSAAPNDVEAQVPRPWAALRELPSRLLLLDGDKGLPPGR